MLELRYKVKNVKLQHVKNEQEKFIFNSSPQNGRRCKIVKEKYIRFGDFIKKKRQKHPDELTLKDVSKMLGISLSFLSDVENNRRKPFDKDKIELFVEKLGLADEEKALMYDLAARDRREVPSDIEDIMMYGEIGDMARLALRQSNAGNISEDDWKQFIRDMEKKNKRED